MFGHYRRTRRQVFLVRQGSYLHKEENTMSKLVITKDVMSRGDLHPVIVAQLELPDDPEIVAIIMEAAASAVQEHLTWQRERGN